MQEKWIIFCIAAVIGMFFFRIAYVRGFFNTFTASRLPVIHGGYVLLAMACYLLGQVIVGPFFIGIYLAVSRHLIEYAELERLLEHFNQLDPYTMGWAHFIFIVCGFLCLAIAYFIIPSSVRKQLWAQTPTPRYRQIGLGIASWIMIYPCVLAINQLVSMIVFYFFEHPEAEQLLVEQMRKIVSWPVLFSSLSLIIFTLVPWSEELLFRGLLQNWLKKLLNSATYSVVITSVIFSCVHLSLSMGWSNIELLLTLFPLSCMLGYLYERQRSLWAPIALHGTYNFIMMVLIWLELE